MGLSSYFGAIIHALSNRSVNTYRLKTASLPLPSCSSVASVKPLKHVAGISPATLGFRDLLEGYRFELARNKDTQDKVQERPDALQLLPLVDLDKQHLILSAVLHDSIQRELATTGSSLSFQRVSSVHWGKHVLPMNLARLYYYFSYCFDTIPDKGNLRKEG